MPYAGDVSDADQINSMVWQGLQRFGCIDILGNNAGARQGLHRVPVAELVGDGLG